jgi:hypothetical protein
MRKMRGSGMRGAFAACELGLVYVNLQRKERLTDLERRMIGGQPTRIPAYRPLQLHGAAFAALFALLAILAALPVLLCETLPLVDYPNHLARMHILSTLKSSAQLQSYYEIVWRPLPNLAMDLTVPLLARWLPLAWAGKAFVVVSLCLMPGGAAVLHRVLFGKWSAWPLLAFLVLYDATLLWGLINYLFGLGVSLFALAFWIALHSRPWLRLASGALFALVLFFAHLLAFGLYGIMVIGYEAGAILHGRLRPIRAMGALILAGAPFLPPAAIYLLLTPKTGDGHIAYLPIGYKIISFFGIFGITSLPFDLTCFAIAVLAAGFAFWRRWVRLHPAMVAPLGLLFLTYLIMPDELETASGADRRIPVLLALLLVASSRWIAPVTAAARAFAGAALLLFLVRLSLFGAAWLESDRLYAQLLPALDGIPAGSRVAVANPFDAAIFPPPSLLHFPTLAVVRRDAFVPTLFALPAQQPIALRPHYAALARQLPPERLWAALVERTAPLDSAERAALAEYDFVIFEGRRHFAVQPSNELSLILATPRFVLARVNIIPANR